MVIDQSMDYTITNPSYRYPSPLIVIHDKVLVPSMTIRGTIKLQKELHQVFFEVVLKCMEFIRDSLSFPKSKPTSPDTF